MFFLFILLFLILVCFTVYFYTKIVELEDDIETLYSSYSKVLDNMIKQKIRKERLC